MTESTQRFLKKRIKKVIDLSHKSGKDLQKALNEELAVCSKMLDFDEEMWKQESVRAVKSFYEKLKQKELEDTNQFKLFWES